MLLATKKLGMSRICKENGSFIAVTLLKIYQQSIINITANKEKKSDIVLLAYDNDKKNTRNIKKPLAGIFKKKNINNYRSIKGFQTKQGALKEGEEFGIKNVKIGNFFNATAISVGKGFAGAMKRHGFKGLEATHGVSVSHRSHGSTGQCQFPGRVFKGKKMAGQMGNKKVTIKNLEVVYVNEENGFLAVKGSVPGAKNSDVFLKPVF